MRGSCASLWKSGLGRNQRSDFRQTGSAILDCSFLLCEMGGTKDLPRGAATCQAPPGDRRRSGLGCWGAGAAAAGQRASGPPRARPGPRGQPGAAAAARGQRALPEVFPSGRHGALARGSPPRIQDLGRGPQAGSGRAENATPLAAGARRASLGAAFPTGGRGWAGPAHPAEPGSRPKNSLPPGRLPGLLPLPTPCGP